MTYSDPAPDGGPPPTWLTEPCPTWCTREHHEDDHTEDRYHRDRGETFAAVLGRVDPVTLRTLAEPDDVVVQRYQHPRESTTWLVVRSAESDVGSLVIAEESVPRLREALAGSRGADRS